MKYSVCVDALYMNNNEKDLFAALKEIDAVGYKDFEFWTWWDKDLDRLVSVKDELGMNLVACCTKFISLTDPAKRTDYLKGLEESIAVAKKLGTNMLITQVGDDTGTDRKFQHDSVVQGLTACAQMLKDAGITMVFEPLNTKVDHKRYYLYSSDEGFEIAREVGSPNIKLLYDCYHQQIMEGDLIRCACANIHLIGHMHAAGNPGRHELSSGELNYAGIFKAMDDAGYKGCMGLEYFPQRAPTEGLREILKY